MIYLGDISARDAAVLADAACNAASILEFGVGASSQVFAQSAPQQARIISLETSDEWIGRTETLLLVMGLHDRIEFRSYADWVREGDRNRYDLVFDDGIDALRLDFAHRAWPLLKDGGKLIFHDTRRSRDYVNALRFAADHFLEISTIEANVASSNLSIITKQPARGYENWNLAEGRSPVMVGAGSIEESVAWLTETLRGRPAEQPRGRSAAERPRGQSAGQR